MKNVCTLFWNLNQAQSVPHQRCAVPLLIIALVAAIGCIACPADGNDGGVLTPDDGGSMNDLTGIAVTNGSSHASTDFGHIRDYNINPPVIGPIADYLTGSPVVTIEANGTLTLNLTTPKPEVLNTFAALITAGSTVSPTDAKFLLIQDGFWTSDGTSNLLYYKDTNNGVGFIYVDKAVTISSGVIQTGNTTQRYDCALKAGWNYFLVTIDGINYHFTSGQPGAGYTWKVD